MQRRKKQLLGAVGLASVMAMTAVAWALPVPDADAVSFGSESGDVNVTVTVESSVPPAQRTPRVTIKSPANLEVVTASTVTVSLELENASSVSLTRYYTNTAGQEVSESVPVTGCVPSSGACDVQVALATVDGAQTRIVAEATSGGRTASDSVVVEYRALSVNIKTETAENGDPIAYLNANQNVYSVLMQVYDKQGNPVFVNVDGKEEPLMISRDELVKNNFKMSVILQMAKYKAAAGKYDLVSVAYAQDMSVISMNVNEFGYLLGGMDVPNTGSVFGSLNISRVDYILTGVIAFGAVAAFVTYLVMRKNHR